MIEISIWLAGYILFVLLQSAFINGVWLSASGETEIMPDGSEKDSEMILYPLKKYLCKKFKKKVYFTDLSSKNKLEKKLNSTGFGTIVVKSYKDSTVFGVIGTFESLKSSLKMIDISLGFDVVESNTTEVANIMIYKAVEEYVFSKYIRKPLIQCIICMASFWGFFTYWIPVYLIFGLNSHTILLWIGNTVILSYTNYLIFKKH